MDFDDSSTSYEGLEAQPSCSYKVDEVDNLSTNQNKQMDRQIDEEDEEDTASNSSNEDSSEMKAEIETARKILSDLMSDSKKAVNWPFMESIQDSAPDLFEEYTKQIEKPIWLKLMKTKFDNSEYKSITEFVSDFRLMLENCYRFNGPDHYISKRGQKLETMLEQKLVLLSRELREKTSIEATSGVKNKGNNSPGFVGMRRRQKTLVPHDSTNLLNQLREQEQQKVREWRKQQILDRKAEKEALALEILSWEDDILFQGKYKQHMKAMWEIPQIGLFLFLCQGPLNVGEVMHFELERCFLIPRESSTMQLIMTSLLSTPFQRLKIDKKSLMPYKVWEYKLRVKVQQWYKVYADTGYDVENTWLKLGIDGRFFEIVGRKNPLEKKKFHELTFYKKVWIVKSLCDNCLQNQDSLRETIELQPFADQREYVLGTDSQGWRYIHFPQFCGADVRVYRQAPIKYPKIEIKPDHFDNKRKFPLVYKPPPPKKLRLQKKKKKMKKQERPSPQPSPNRQRPSRLRQSVKQVVPLQLGDSAENTGTDSSSDSEGDSGENQMEVDETGDADSAENSVLEEEEDNSVATQDNSLDTNDLNDNLETKSVVDADRLSSGSDVTIPYCDVSDTNSTYSSRDCSRESSPFRSADLRVRRSVRLEKLSDGSREASPLIYDSDFRYSRSSRSKGKLKSSKFKASRNLSSFLFDENSTSNSSAFGEPSASISGILTERLLGNANLNLNSNSSETGEESNDCDIQKLFGNASKAESREDLINQGNDASKNSLDDSTDLDNEVNMSASKHSAETAQTKFTKTPDANDILIGHTSSNTILDDGFAISDSNIAESGDNSRDSCAEFSVTKTKSKHIPNGVVMDINHDDDNGKTSNLSDKGSEIHVGDWDLDTNTDTKSNCVENQHQDIADDNEKHNVRTAKADINNSDIDSESFDSNTKTVSCLFQSSTVIDKKDQENMTELEDKKITNKIFEGMDEYTEMAKPELEITENTKLESPYLHENFTKENFKTDEKYNMKDESIDNSWCEKGQLVEDLKSEIKIPIKTSTDIGFPGEEYSLESCNGVKTKLLDDVKYKQVPNNDDLERKVQIKSDKDVKDEIVNEDDGMLKEEDNDKFNGKKLVMDMETEEKDDEDDKINGKILEKEKKNDDKLNEDQEKEVDKNGNVSESEEEEEEEMVPDLNEFELLADSVEDLRRLTAQFEEQEPIIIKKGKKEQITRPPPRKKCVVHLHERLQYLLKELEPWESRLVQATKRARIRVRKEVEDYVEPPDTEDSKWNTTDEETESGGSEDEVEKTTKDGDDSKDGLDDTGKLRAGGLTGRGSRDNLSGASTPVKFDDSDEIDISQRGRLRKRRIIPNNAEDQIAPKKPKLKIETNLTDIPTSSNPIIIHSGKSQMVEYSDILRQLKNANAKGNLPPGMNPVLIKTTQGGRTVLTSVLPLNTSQSNSTQKLNNVKLVSPLALQQISGQNVQFALPVTSPTSSSTKISQHPTIQYLLTGSNSVTPSSVKEIPSSATTVSMIKVLPQAAVQNEGTKSNSTQPNLATEVTPVKVGQPQTVMITPEKLATIGQPAQQKIVFNPSVTPRKIAPHPHPGTVNKQTLTKGSVKYYAANASTLPINVVQQLLATRGAKLQTRPNQQSILYIPMENNEDTINVAPLQGKYVSGIPQTTPNSISPDSKVTMMMTVVNTHSTVSVSTPATSTSNTKSKSPVTTNMLILPKPLTSPVMNPTSSPSGFVALPVSQVSNHSPTATANLGVSKTVKTLFQSRLATGALALMPTSPPRYPTNETVRTLLDKRKSVDDKGVVRTINVTITDNKPTAYACIASQLQRPCAPSMVSSVMLKKIAASADPLASSSGHPVTMALTEHKTVKQDNVFGDSSVKVTSVHQHVLTSISPAKLNTLLLQTSAAGAKSIPSLIKLPSKAVLDSAVKAVVTSVNTTLPTVNIKVPSPTSLPSIGPRRNVTKTIQTMKSPIPVAPKVVTQNSGRTSLSVADSHCVFSTQSTIVNSSQSNSTAQSNTTPVHAHVVTSGTNGQKVLAKLPSLQGGIRSETLSQMGYLTPQGYVIPVSKLQQNVDNHSATAMLNQIGLQAQVKQEVQGSQSTPTGVQLMMPSTEGLLQLVPSLNLQSQTTENSLSVQTGNQTASCNIANLQAKKGNGNKQVVAINAQGKHIIVKQKGATTASQFSSELSGIQSNQRTLTQISGKILPSQVQPSPVAPNLKPAVASPNMELKLPTGNYLLPQTVPGLLKPAPSPVVTQPMLPPLLNMQPVLLPGAGIQLASPVVNPVGLNLLQTNMPLGNQSLTTNSMGVRISNSQALSSSKVVNINQTFLSQALAGSLGQHQRKLAPAVTSRLQAPTLLMKPASISPVTSEHNPETLVGMQHCVSKGGISVANTPVHGQQRLTLNSISPRSMTGSSPPLILSPNSTPLPGKPKQLVFQYALPPQNINKHSSSSEFTNKVTNLSTQVSSVASQQVFANAHVDQNVSCPKTHFEQHMHLSKDAKQQNVQVIAKINTDTKSTTACSGTNELKPSDQNLSMKPNQFNQKLLLYSIAGQLVTGQGVPVTVHQGVLKVMPQGKLHIANQTLTPEQIKQTLAKIGNTIVPSDTNLPKLTQGEGNSNPQSSDSDRYQAAFQGVQAVTAASTDKAQTSAIGKLSLAVKDHKPQTPATGTLSLAGKDHERQLSATETSPLSVMDHDYQNKQKVSCAYGRVKHVISSASVNEPDNKPDYITVEPLKPDIVLKGAKSNSVYIMKPTTSTGYTVFPSPFKGEELQLSDSIPVVRDGNIVASKLVQGHIQGQFQGQGQTSQVQTIVKTSGVNINGKDVVAAGRIVQTVNNTKVENDLIDDEETDSNDDDDGNQLIIDDSANEKEAALNLLTLANQALGPTSKSVKK